MMYMLIDVCYEHSVPFLDEAMEGFGPLSENGLDLSVVACCVVAQWLGLLEIREDSLTYVTYLFKCCDLISRRVKRHGLK